MKKESLTQKIVRLAIFLAMGVVLNIVESLIPIPIAVPGVKLGLANTMGLIVLYFYSPKEYFVLGGLRIFIVGLLRTGIGSTAFFMGLAGWLLSSIVTLLIYLLHKSSIYGLSIISALFHQVGQIIMISIFYNSPEMALYLPILMFTGAISGLLVAYVSTRILLLLNKVFKIKPNNI